MSNRQEAGWGVEHPGIRTHVVGHAVRPLRQREHPWVLSAGHIRPSRRVPGRIATGIGRRECEPVGPLPRAVEGNDETLVAVDGFD